MNCAGGSRRAAGVRARRCAERRRLVRRAPRRDLCRVPQGGDRPPAGGDRVRLRARAGRRRAPELEDGVVAAVQPAQPAPGDPPPSQASRAHRRHAARRRDPRRGGRHRRRVRRPRGAAAAAAGAHRAAARRDAAALRRGRRSARFADPSADVLDRHARGRPTGGRAPGRRSRSCRRPPTIRRSSWSATSPSAALPLTVDHHEREGPGARAGLDPHGSTPPAGPRSRASSRAVSTDSSTW